MFTPHNIKMIWQILHLIFKSKNNFFSQMEGKIKHQIVEISK